MSKYFFLFFGLLVTQAEAQQTIGLFQNDSLSLNGYTLFSPNRMTYLIDNCGNLVNSWESDYPPGSSVYLLENGDLLRPGRVFGEFGGGGVGGRLEIFNWEGDLIWYYEYATDSVHQHHDVEPLPNGNILVLAWELKTPEMAIASGRNPATNPDGGLWPEHIVELKREGTTGASIVWEWHLWDHLVQQIDTTLSNYGIIAEHPELLDINFSGDGIAGSNTVSDWIHANAIAYNADLDQIAISSRVASEIWIIDHSTTTEEAAGHTGGNAGKGGDILYRWGNPQIYGRGDMFDQTLFGQHDIKWIPPGFPDAGKLIIFNNGTSRPGGTYSSVDVFQAPLQNDGSYFIEEGLAFGPFGHSWSYNHPEFYSPNISGAQRLPNGNTLICEGREGRFFEVTYDGDLVWEYFNPTNFSGVMEQGSSTGSGSVFRATRYPTTYPAFQGRELVDNGPIELNPIPIDCTIFGEYTTTSVSGIFKQEKPYRLLSNPVVDRIAIQFNLDGQYSLQLLDLTARPIARYEGLRGMVNIPVNGLPQGLFLIQILAEDQQNSWVEKLIKN